MSIVNVQIIISHNYLIQQVSLLRFESWYVGSVLNYQTHNTGSSGLSLANFENWNFANAISCDLVINFAGFGNLCSRNGIKKVHLQQKVVGPAPPQLCGPCKLPFF